LKAVGVFEIDGAQLVYEIEGHGDETLAFVHGWCSTLRHWDPQAEHFRSSRRVVRWDRRGMGRSTAEQPAQSPARHGDDLAALLDAERIRRVTVIGHAGGGPAALTFAERHADRTDALVLVDTRLHAPSAQGDGDRFAEAVERSCQRIARDEDGEFFRGLYRSFFGPRAAPAIVAAAVENAVATRRDIAVTEMRHILGDTMELARRVRCPVLWVSAQPDDTAVVRSAFPDVTIGHVVGSGHFVQLEVPEQLNAMIEAFLDGRPSDL
jgi:pimeloyl-ACP methyl ester carboxylesterase